MFTTCVLEELDTALEEMLGFEIGVHHGIALLAMATAARALHELLEGFEAASGLAEASELARLEAEVETVEKIKQAKGEQP